jgi:hypothetical protein
VVELVGLHRAKDADVIDDAGQMRQNLRNFRARFSVFGKLVARSHHGGIGADKGVALALGDRGRQGLALVLDQVRLVVEQVELRRRTRHKKVDDAFSLRREMGLFQRLRSGGVQAGAGERFGQQRGQRDLPHPDPALAEKVPPRRSQRMLVVFQPAPPLAFVCHSRFVAFYRLTIASSRFRTARAVTVHAARSIWVVVRTPGRTGEAGGVEFLRFQPGFLLFVEGGQRGQFVPGRRARDAAAEQIRRLGVGRPGRAAMRAPSACAASTKTSSLSSVRACSGVFDTSRCGQVASPDGASKVLNIA